MMAYELVMMVIRDQNIPWIPCYVYYLEDRRHQETVHCKKTYDAGCLVTLFLWSKSGGNSLKGLCDLMSRGCDFGKASASSILVLCKYSTSESMTSRNSRSGEGFLSSSWRFSSMVLISDLFGVRLSSLARGPKGNYIPINHSIRKSAYSINGDLRSTRSRVLRSSGLRSNLGQNSKARVLLVLKSDSVLLSFQNCISIRRACVDYLVRRWIPSQSICWVHVVPKQLIH